MLAIAGQTAGPTWMILFKETLEEAGGNKKFDLFNIYFTKLKT